jgi:pimeloyl-ACP methyl ester carboxylesterase
VPSVGRLRFIEAPARGGVRPRGALILIHAFPLNARMWEPQHAMAERGWRVIAPQLRQFDGGEQDPQAASIDDYAGDVIDLLDALHIPEAVIAGLSMGGYVALAMFRHAPRYVQGLVLADTRAEADTAEGVAGRKRMLALVAEKGPPAIADEMLPKLVGHTTATTRPEIVEQVRSLALSSSAAAISGALKALMTRPDSTSTLASIHRPTLVIVGDEDVVTPPPLSENLHKGIPGSELVRIANAGHLSSLERPDAFNAALAKFLDHRV